MREIDKADKFGGRIEKVLLLETRLDSVDARRINLLQRKTWQVGRSAQTYEVWRLTEELGLSSVSVRRNMLGSKS